MTKHGREQTFRIITGQRERIGMADTGVGDLDQHFALLRRRDIDLDDLQRFASGEGNGSTGFHGKHSKAGNKDRQRAVARALISGRNG